MEMQEFEKLKIKIGKRPCHICGNRKFEWGYGTSLYGANKWKVARGSGQLSAARKCLTCNNVQLFAYEEVTRDLRRTGCLWVLGIVVLAMIIMYFVIPGILIGISQAIK